MQARFGYKKENDLEEEEAEEAKEDFKKKIFS